MEDNKLPLLAQDDAILRLIAPRHRALVICIFILLLAIIIWAFLGHIPIDARGKGMLMTPNGVSSVKSMVNGTVLTISGKIGQNIKKGDLIATIYDPSHEKKSKDALSLYKSLEYQNSLLPTLKEEYKEEQEAYKKGLVTSVDLEESKQRYLSQMVTIETTERSLIAAIAQLEMTYYVSELAKIPQSHQSLDQSALAKKIKDLDHSPVVNVYSPFDGKITSSQYSPGDLVSPGDWLFRLEHPLEEGQQITTYAYFEPSMGNHIRPGMLAKLTLFTVDLERWGYVHGRVKNVLQYASAKGEINNIMPNTEITDFLLDGHRAVIQVIIEPVLDPEAPSGYKWSSGMGPNVQLQAGTMCDIKVVYEQRHPIYYLFPVWRDFVESITDKKFLATGKKHD